MLVVQVQSNKSSADAISRICDPTRATRLMLWTYGYSAACSDQQMLRSIS